VAQGEAWRVAADRIREAAGKVAGARTTDLDAVLKQLKSDGVPSWSTPPEAEAGGQRVLVLSAINQRFSGADRPVWAEGAQAWLSAL